MTRRVSKVGQAARYPGSRVLRLPGDGGWLFIPLREGWQARPAVTYLHGFALSDPTYYDDHIRHLNLGGHAVVFPRINRRGLALLGDRDQNAMLGRAITAAEKGLAQLREAGGAGETRLFGHSLGGLLAACWAGGGGPAPASITLANPSTAGRAGHPWIRRLNWPELAGRTTAGVLAIAGVDDRIAPPEQARRLLAAMPRARYRRLVTVRTRGASGLRADHLSPMTSPGSIPRSLLRLAGSPVEVSELNLRVYYPALDASLASTSSGAGA